MPWASVRALSVYSVLIIIALADTALSLAPSIESLITGAAAESLLINSACCAGGTRCDVRKGADLRDIIVTCKARLPFSRLIAAHG